MSIPYFGKNGPITIQEIFNLYSNNANIDLTSDIVNEPIKGALDGGNLTEPTIDNNTGEGQYRDYFVCRNCCFANIMGGRSSPCPPGVIFPLNRSCRAKSGAGCLPTRKYTRPKEYFPTKPPLPGEPFPSGYPWCCDSTDGPITIPDGGRRHNIPPFSPYYQAMTNCLRRKGITRKDETTAEEIQKCLQEVQKLWDDQKKKDDDCFKLSTDVQDCIDKCRIGVTDPCGTTTTQTQ